MHFQIEKFVIRIKNYTYKSKCNNPCCDCYLYNTSVIQESFQSYNESNWLT